MNDPSSSVAQPLNRTLNGTITSATREKAVYLLHSNVKILTNAIAALSKIGDEIFLQPQERGEFLHKKLLKYRYYYRNERSVLVGCTAIEQNVEWNNYKCHS
ncbi:hypothetical protein NECAME_05899 [Necator americanus]|uniref:Uncharacterized protein n=1 Tax=Necator americanus TaxID=51031 RepID=W2TWY7_NECAM|nr:hypothetical protein NECAME_05899 [Necator americanus]ETN86595.1 hypothetical protein NECAME_05899 [Necator americanus]